LDEIACQRVIDEQLERISIEISYGMSKYAYNRIQLRLEEEELNNALDNFISRGVMGEVLDKIKGKIDEDINNLGVQELLAAEEAERKQKLSKLQAAKQLQAQQKPPEEKGREAMNPISNEYESKDEGWEESKQQTDQDPIGVEQNKSALSEPLVDINTSI